MEKEIRGIFDGQYMLGFDKRQYPVPSNYASKSKLVEGDELSLKMQGGMVYKLVDPIERETDVMKVINDNGKIRIKHKKDKYDVLQASITFFALEDGMEVIASVPKCGEGSWACVEDVITKI